MQRFVGMRRYRYEIGAITDIGNRPGVNQDSFLVRRGRLGKEEVCLLAVADGMGGMAHGEAASGRAVEMLEEWWSLRLPSLLSPAFLWEDIGSSLSVLIESINWSIRNHINGAGTTLSLLFVCGKRYLLRHVGDSRIYLVRKVGVAQLTKDQTWCQREIDHGRLTPQELATHPKRHMLISALGIAEEYICQESGGELQAGDRIVLCSDGFYQEINLAAWLSTSGRKGIAALLEGMLAEIKAGAAPDNITAVLLRVRQGVGLLG